MISTDFIFRQQENLVDNQKCQAGFRPLCNKIPLYRNRAFLIFGSSLPGKKELKSYLKPSLKLCLMSMLWQLYKLWGKSTFLAPALPSYHFCTLLLIIPVLENAGMALLIIHSLISWLASVPYSQIWFLECLF